LIALQAMTDIPSGLSVAITPQPKVTVDAYRVDDVLKPIDVLCEQWKEQAFDWPPTGATPIYRGMKQREGAALPGGPPVMTDAVQMLDRVLASSPREHMFIVVWYVHGGSISQKGHRLGISRSQMYIEHKATLGYLRGRLHSQGLNV
jgi:hypothetical protein